MVYKIVHTIPRAYEDSHYLKSNFREMIMNGMKKNGLKCNCIFCKEIGDKKIDDLTQIMVVKKYSLDNRNFNYLISIEAHDMNFSQKCAYIINRIDNYIYWFFTGKWNYWSGDIKSLVGRYAFIRLRTNPDEDSFYGINNKYALIRDVVICASSFDASSVNIRNNIIGNEYSGFGELLINVAEEFSSMNGYYMLALITNPSNIENYKNRYGFTHSFRREYIYMLKELTSYNYNIVYRIIITCIIVVFFYYNV